MSTPVLRTFSPEQLSPPLSLCSPDLPRDSPTLCPGATILRATLWSNFCAAHQVSLSPGIHQRDILPTSPTLNSYLQCPILGGNTQSAGTRVLIGGYQASQGTYLGLLLQGIWWHPPALGPRSSKKGNKVAGRSCLCPPPRDARQASASQMGAPFQGGRKHLCSSENPPLYTLLPLSPFITLRMSAAHM